MSQSANETDSTASAKNSAEQSQTTIRRRDRAVHDEVWIRTFLAHAPMGVLAAACDNQPYLTTTLFVYDDSANAIYAHSSRSGRMPTMLAQNRLICFTVGEMGRLLPSTAAMDFSVEYASVVIFGRAMLIEDSSSALAALQLLLDKYFPHLRPGSDYQATTVDDLSRTAVYRIAIDEWSAKRKVADVDFPGAFIYGLHDTSRSSND